MLQRIKAREENVSYLYETDMVWARLEALFWNKENVRCNKVSNVDLEKVLGDMRFKDNALGH